MKRITAFFIVVVIALCGRLAPAQDEPATQPSFTGMPAAQQAAARYETQKQAAKQRYDAAFDDARRLYIAALKREQTEQARKHNADQAAQIGAVIDQLEAEGAAYKETAKTPTAGASTGGGAKELNVDLGGGVQMKFIRIPAGEFVMGSPPNEAGRFGNETQHRVRISRAFMLAATLTTQAQWNAIMAAKPGAKSDDAPVDAVLWPEAVDFCQKLGQKDGKHYRLPTEAEFEYAARAGTQTAFDLGDNEAALAEASWYGGNSGGHKHPVAQKKPNAWGLYDMNGNLWEWCSDWHADYLPGDAVDPQGPAQGQQRVLRGGSWEDAPKFVRCAFRQKFNPTGRDICLGFRCAMDLP